MSRDYKSRSHFCLCLLMLDTMMGACWEEVVISGTCNMCVLEAGQAWTFITTYRGEEGGGGVRG